MSTPTITVVEEPTSVEVQGPSVSLTEQTLTLVETSDGATVSVVETPETVTENPQTVSVMGAVAVSIVDAGAQGPPGPGAPVVASDGEVLFWDAATAKAKGDSDFVFNPTLKTLTLGSGHQLLLPNGTSAAPSLALSADADTGFFSYGTAGALVYSSNGIDRMMLATNVGLSSASAFGWGATTPSSALNTYFTHPATGQLQLNSSDTDAKLIVKAGSAQTLNLQEWQNSSGTALASVTPAGYLCLPAGAAGTPSLYFGTDTNTGIWGIADNVIAFSVNGYGVMGVQGNIGGLYGFIAGNGSGYGWNGSTVNAAADLRLERDAAGVLAQRNGVNAQEFRVYNTTVASPAAAEYGSFGWTSNTLHLQALKSGAGTQRVLRLGGPNGVVIDSDNGVMGSYGIMTLGAIPWTSNCSPYFDITYDLGTSSHRWRSAHLGGAAAVIPLIIKLHASQTANALEVQNSSGTALASVDPAGTITAPKVAVAVGGPQWTCGAGDPDGVVTAPVGSLYTRTDGGAGTTLYVKEVGTDYHGWAAK